MSVSPAQWIASHQRKDQRTALIRALNLHERCGDGLCMCGVFCASYPVWVEHLVEEVYR